MKKEIIKIFDDLEPYETRVDGTFYYDADEGGRVYSARGWIFDDQILYSVHFVRKKIGKNLYSETPTKIRGYLQSQGVRYELTNIKIDREHDEFFFTFENENRIIQLDCEITDFKFRCEYLGK